MGMSPVEIVDQHSTITLAQVHAGLAFYDDHQCEIQAEIAEEDRALRDGAPGLAAPDSRS
jgi:hypothetical protein